VEHLLRLLEEAKKDFAGQAWSGRIIIDLKKESRLFYNYSVTSIKHLEQEDNELRSIDSKLRDNGAGFSNNHKIHQIDELYHERFIMLKRYLRSIYENIDSHGDSRVPVRIAVDKALEILTEIKRESENTATFIKKEIKNVEQDITWLRREDKDLHFFRANINSWLN
jgi:hypothetical protein